MSKDITLEAQITSTPLFILFEFTAILTNAGLKRFAYEFTFTGIFYQVSINAYSNSSTSSHSGDRKLSRNAISALTSSE